MTSEKQIAANRLNSLKSTGPRTPEGKSKTRLNARRDGFTCQMISLSEEDAPVFDEFRCDFIDDLQPQTMMETSLASAIAWDTWRLNHLRAMEMNKFALGAVPPNIEVTSDNPELQSALADSVTFTRQSDSFALMSVYEQRMTRNLHKNLATLRELQSERKREYEQDLEEEVVLACASDVKGLPYEAPSTPTANGSVFSNREIFSAANRATTVQMARQTLRETPLRIFFAGAASATPPNVASWPEPEAA